MTKHTVNDIFRFKSTCQHPDSKIVGVDEYDFNAVNGKNRNWDSYTLVPTDPANAVTPYDRQYVVNLPDLGLSFVSLVKESSLPKNLTVEEKLTGSGTNTTQGDGELGTGEIKLISWWDNNVTPPVMYAKETFADGEVLYFKTLPLVGLKQTPS